MTEAERQALRRAAKARYRERNRAELRVKNRAYAERKRREAGHPPRGSAESHARMLARPRITGEAHANWKGQDAGYIAIHGWLARHKHRTGICSECGSEPGPARDGRAGTDWANVSGQYHRDLDDFIELCRRCHIRRDRGLAA